MSTDSSAKLVPEIAGESDIEYDKRNALAIVLNLRAQHPEAQSIHVCAKQGAMTSLSHDFLVQNFSEAELVIQDNLVLAGHVAIVWLGLDR